MLFLQMIEVTLDGSAFCKDKKKFAGEYFKLGPGCSYLYY